MIGTIASEATKDTKIQSDKDIEVVIITGDRDILQLVDDKKNIKQTAAYKSPGFLAHIKC